MSKPEENSSRGPEARSWTKVVIDVCREDAEEAAAFLTELTGTGVESVALEGEVSPSRERIVGYLGDDSLYPTQKKELDRFLEGLGRKSPDRAPVVMHSEPVLEQDWQRVWKTHFRTARVSRRLVVRPTWETYEAGEDERVIEIDPGMAFGTGLHATTRLTLGFIDDLYPAAGRGPESVLDAGTGTGILSIACTLLGAGRVLAVDSDPLAAKAAAKNIRRNKVEDVVTVHPGADLTVVKGPFDLIAANINHNALRGLAPFFASCLADDGVLLLAGVLKGDQEESLARRYGELGFEFLEDRVLGEWAGLKFKGGGKSAGGGKTLDGPREETDV
jgi:ribosomal protein L11 methyltransferase